MAWTAPRTWVAGETVTAAIMNTHIRDNLNVLVGAAVIRIAGSTFSTDLVSTGATEVVGYSQTATLVSGMMYRVNFNGVLNAATAGNVAGLRIRYSTSALTNTSTLAGVQQTQTHSAAGTAGRITAAFFVEFTAPSSNTFNIGVGVFTVAGTGNETIVGTAAATAISIDQIGPA